MAFAYLGIVLSLMIGAVAGLFRAESLAGRARLPEGRPVWPLMIAFVIAVSVWLMVQVSFGMWKQARLSAVATHPVVLEESMLTGNDLAVLATAAPAAGFLLLCSAHLLVRSAVGQDFGFSLRRLPHGTLLGATAFAAIMPLLLGVSVLTEEMYNRIGFQHPSEHELLKVMGEAAGSTKLALVFGAVVLAPLFEELLFRGYLQTILRRVFSRARSRRSLALPPLAVLVPPGSEGIDLALPLPVAQSSDLPAPRPFIESAAAWTAILLTSAMFALVHPKWTWPPIFALSVCLGWLYERTGNLWAPITVHALFNAASTLWYLHTLPPH